MYDSDDLTAWQATLDVNLRATMVSVHLAARAMARRGTRGAIVSVSSAAGVFAMPQAPVYAAAKAGLVHVTRSSAAMLSDKGIRIATVCPQFVDTGATAQECTCERRHRSERQS
jgi:NAD(P)-dependent dehydrogenase (short-subunit alcohol dehydrogenase family)